MRYRDAVFSLVSKRAIALLVVVVGTTSWASFAFAQQAASSADEEAKELANPAGSLASLANNLQYRSFKGDLPDADSQDSWGYTFQPVLPFPVGDKGRNIIVRPAFTFSFDQPVFDPEQGQFKSLDTNFNDITFDTVYAGNTMKTKERGYLWGAGLAGTLPTATDSALGGDQWRFGPEIFAGVLRAWGVFGALVNNQWNVSGGGGEPGTSNAPFSAMTAQYFYGISLGNGWQILSAPVISQDWNAESGEGLSLPIGTGIARTVKLGSTAWRFQTEVWYYVVSPDSFGSNWFWSFEARPVIKNPFVGLF